MTARSIADGIHTGHGSACPLVVSPLARCRARHDQGRHHPRRTRLFLLQVGAAALGYGVEAAPAFAVAVVVGVVVPVLTYAFLASIWFLKVSPTRCAAAFSSQVRPRRGTHSFEHTGPSVTMNIAGRIRTISGKRIFVGVFCARSSAA